MTPEEAVEAVAALCKWRQLPRIDVVVHQGKKPKNWYQVGSSNKEEHLGVDPRCLNVATLAHGWAHYAHHHEYRRRRSEARRQLLLNPGAVGADSELRHGPQWQQLLEEAQAFLSGRGAPTVTPRQQHGGDAGIRASALAQLAPMLHCPRCRLDIPREQIGIRIMSRGDDGVPTRVRRQSYCIPCRSRKGP